MPRLTNTTRENIEVPTGVKDGMVQMEAIGPGETKTVNCAPDDPTLVAHLRSGGLTTEDKRVAKAVEAAAAPSA
ncbi:hypothetical protein [Methylobacterium aquaticum]|uniref:hypothetical protein n=1 Tax=Methylobacterium aquaticum TaxID=270351 RepID=UPI001932B401|nr:hypothetical protein [Methylobacterium aquaticum]QRE77346.1 hypothetical protein F1D61_30890 [Methylobacterium aquaticum]